MAWGIKTTDTVNPAIVYGLCLPLAAWLFRENRRLLSVILSLSLSLLAVSLMPGIDGSLRAGLAATAAIAIVTVRRFAESRKAQGYGQGAEERQRPRASDTSSRRLFLLLMRIARK